MISSSPRLAEGWAITTIITTAALSGNDPLYALNYAVFSIATRSLPLLVLLNALPYVAFGGSLPPVTSLKIVMVMVAAALPYGFAAIVASIATEIDFL